jgi:hypothetical protein
MYVAAIGLWALYAAAAFSPARCCSGSFAVAGMNWIALHVAGAVIMASSMR